MPQSQPSDAEAPASQHDEPPETFAAPHEGDSDGEFDPQ